MGVASLVRYATAAALVLSAPAGGRFVEPSQFATGNGFLEQCSSDGNERFACLMYLDGITDGWRGAFAYLGATSGQPALNTAFCLRDGSTLGQQLDVVLEFLRRNPAQRDGPIHLLIPVALRQAFPCPKK